MRVSTLLSFDTASKFSVTNYSEAVQVLARTASGRLFPHLTAGLAAFAAAPAPAAETEAESEAARLPS